MFGQQHARERGTETRSEFSVSGLYERMKSWFQGNLIAEDSSQLRNQSAF